MMAIGDTEYLDAIASACDNQGTSSAPDSNSEVVDDIANVALSTFMNDKYPYDVAGAAATSVLTVPDGDDATASQWTEGTSIRMTSTDGTSRYYVTCRSGQAGSPSTGDILGENGDTGASTLDSQLFNTGVQCVAVVVSASATQSAYLNKLKDAVEHANGHNGRITVSAAAAVSDGPKTMTFTQKIEGRAGNTTVTCDVPVLTTKPDFSGGIGTAATCTITVTDGDAVTLCDELGNLKLISTDGTTRKYVIVDDAPAGTQAATGTALSTGADTGASTLPAGLDGAIAVTIPDLSSSTQNAVLVQFKAAIESAAGHNGKIFVSEVPTQADGKQAITLFQATAGATGNTVHDEEEGGVGEDLDDIAVTDFSGGTGNKHATYNFTIEPGSSGMPLDNIDNAAAVKLAVEKNFMQFAKKVK